MVRDSFEGHTGDPERDIAYEREHMRRELKCIVFVLYCGSFSGKRCLKLTVYQ